MLTAIALWAISKLSKVKDINNDSVDRIRELTVERGVMLDDQVVSQNTIRNYIGTIEVLNKQLEILKDRPVSAIYLKAEAGTELTEIGEVIKTLSDSQLDVLIGLMQWRIIWNQTEKEIPK